MPHLLHLVPHSSSPCRPISAIEVRVGAAQDGGLNLSYTLQGDPTGLRIPAPCPAGATDDLWRHTCCEAFVGVPGERAYREFNFSPSGQWAAYVFTDTRQRQAGHPPVSGPTVHFRRLSAGLELLAHIPAALLPPADLALRLGLTAVIEGADGSLSYWALFHPGETPDFHHRGGFVLALAGRGSLAGANKFAPTRFNPA